MSPEFCLLFNSAFMILVITGISIPFQEPTNMIILLHDMEK